MLKNAVTDQKGKEKTKGRKAEGAEIRRVWGVKCVGEITRHSLIGMGDIYTSNPRLITLPLITIPQKILAR